MKLFASNPAPTPWVAPDGTVRTETAGQRELIATPAFILALSLYKKAIEKGQPTASIRLQNLNKALEGAKEAVPELPASIQP